MRYTKLERKVPFLFFFLPISFFKALPLCPNFQVDLGLLEGVYLFSQGRWIRLLFFILIITHGIKRF